MFFMINHTAAFDSPREDATLHHFYTWTLHRKDKDAEDQLGEAICRSVSVFATERQARAAINTAKRAMGGVRFAQTRVQE